MRPHGQNLLREMLDEAKSAVTHAEMHPRKQEARLVEQDRKGKQRAESAKLLRNMREAQSPMMKHVRLLESEIKADGKAKPKALRR